MPDPIWSHAGIDMTWRGSADEPLLFVGDLCVGRIFPIDEESAWFTPDHVWRAQIMTECFGHGLGGYATVEAAQDVLVDAAVKALLGDAP